MALPKTSYAGPRKEPLSLSALQLVAGHDVACCGDVLALYRIEHEAIAVVHAIVSWRINVVYFGLVDMGYRLVTGHQDGMMTWRYKPAVAGSKWFQVENLILKLI